jgi:hypothetical protein
MQTSIAITKNYLLSHFDFKMNMNLNKQAHSNSFIGFSKSSFPRLYGLVFPRIKSKAYICNILRILLLYSNHYQFVWLVTPVLLKIEILFHLSMYVCSSLIQLIGKTIQATETELFDTGLSPLLKLLEARTEMMGSYPNNHPFSISGHTYPLHNGEAKGHRALLAMSRPRLLSSEHPLSLPR